MRRRLQNIMTADFDEAASDKDDICQTVKTPKLSDGIQNDHLRARAVILLRAHLGAAQDAVAVMLDGKFHGRRSRDLTNSEKQTRLRIFFQDLTKGAEYDLLLSAVRGTGDDDRALPVEAEFFTKRGALFLRHFGVRLIVLGIACDGAALRLGAHRDDALLVDAGLHAETPDLAEHARREALDQRIAAHRAAADASIHHHDRDLFAESEAKEIRPQLRFDQNDRLGIHDIYDALGDDGQVKGEENVSVSLWDDALCHAVTGRSDDRHHHHFIRVLLLQLAHDRARGDHFTDGSGMHPDGIVVGDLLQRGRRHDAGALLQTVIEAFFEDKPIDQDRYLQQPVGDKTNVVNPVQFFLL